MRAHVDVRVPAAPARLVALRRQPALELHDDAVHRGEVLQRAAGERPVELVQRPRRRQRLGALDLRALELAAQVQLEAADLVARERLRRAARDGSSRPARRAPSAARASGGSAARRRRARRSPARGARTRRSPAAARSRIAASSPSRIARRTCSRSVVEVDPLAAGDPVRVLLLAVRGRLAHALAQRRALRGAEEEALEHEVEHAPVLGRLGQRGGQRLAERRRRRPVHLAERRERVVELGGPDRHALGPQLLGEAQDVGGEAHLRAPA